MGAALRIAVAALLLAAGCGSGEDVRVEEVGWVVESADPASREIRVMVGVGGGCSSLERVVATEDANRVRIRAWVRTVTQRDCALSCRSNTKELRLREPLGSREIVASNRPPRCGLPATTTTTPRPA